MAFFQHFGRTPRLGAYIGYMSSMGSAGRAAGPLVAVALYSASPSGLAVFAANAGLVAAGSVASGLVF